MIKVKEKGAHQKPWKNRVKIALVYPNKYGVGMSSLGYQTMYRLLNERAFITCDRVFLPENENGKPEAIENSRYLNEFDFVLFSVSYSTDYLNVFEILKRSGIALSWKDRKDKMGPLIAAGGTAIYMNPEPLASVMDFFFLGEGEVFSDSFGSLLDSYPGIIGDRAGFLESIKACPGIYVPEFLNVTYEIDGTVRSFENRRPDTKIARAYVEDIKGFSTHSSLFSEEAEFGELFLEEISRGCARGCRFCAIGYIGRPYRTRPFHGLEFVRTNPHHKIGILGAAISDHPNIKDIARFALENGRAISFSSFRADKIDEEMIEIIRKAKIETFTIAPESSSRIRHIINKDLTDQELLGSVSLLSMAGVKNLKVYFMIGLPFEDEKTTDEIASLIREIRDRFKVRKITVSINPFIPKPFTPFQWSPFAMQDCLKRTFFGLKKELGAQRINFERLSLKSAVLDAIFSKGNRGLGEKIIRWYGSGEDPTRKLLEEAKSEDHFIHKELSTDRTLPWDFIDNHVKKSMLIDEYSKAKSLALKR